MPNKVNRASVIWVGLAVVMICLAEYGLAAAGVGSVPAWGTSAVSSLVVAVFAVEVVGLHFVAVTLLYLLGTACAFWGGHAAGVFVFEMLPVGASYAVLGAMVLLRGTRPLGLCLIKKAHLRLVVAAPLFLVTDVLVSRWVMAATYQVLICGIFIPLAGGVCAGWLGGLVFGRSDAPAEAGESAVRPERKPVLDAGVTAEEDAPVVVPPPASGRVISEKEILADFFELMKKI